MGSVPAGEVIVKIPTPREVAQARTEAALLRAIDEIAHREHITVWNEQVDATVAALAAAAHDGHGSVIEFSYTDNVIRAFPEPRLRPGSAALFNLDTGLHHYRDIRPDQIGRTP